MHLHSLAWLGVVTAAAACLYQRLFGPGWIAGLAALLFAVDDARGMPAAWLANRNALIGMAFGILTLIFHHRWRRDGWWMGAVMAPVMFLCGLLAKESAVAIGAYLTAHALFLDRGRFIVRFCSCLPYLLVGLLWWLYYSGQGYGTAGSGWYINPLIDPLGYLQAVATRAPTLLAWQWLVPCNLEWALSQETAHLLWLGAMGLLLITASAVVLLLKNDPLARFWALGMVLSLFPACAAYPSSRLLLFVGLGGMGLLAQLLSALFDRFRPSGRPARARLPALGLFLYLVLLHLVMAPLDLFRTNRVLEDIARSMARTEASLPSDRASRVQTLLIVRSPSYAVLAYTALSRVLEGSRPPVRTLVLGSGGNPMEVFRPDEKTLVIRPEGGFFAVPGAWRPDPEIERLLFHQGSAMESLDRLYRDRTPMIEGQRIKLFGAVVEITALSGDGRPAEAAFRFLTKLENPFFRWLAWEGGGFVPFELPSVGETVRIQGVSIPLDG